MTTSPRILTFFISTNFVNMFLSFGNNHISYSIKITLYILYMNKNCPLFEAYFMVQEPFGILELIVTHMIQFSCSSRWSVLIWCVNVYWVVNRFLQYGHWYGIRGCADLKCATANSRKTNGDWHTPHLYLKNNKKY